MKYTLSETPILHHHKMYKLLIATNITPLTVTAIDLATDQQLTDAVKHYETTMPSAIFGIIKGNTITFLNYEQYKNRFELLKGADTWHQNFELNAIKKVTYYL